MPKRISSPLSCKLSPLANVGGAVLHDDMMMSIASSEMPWFADCSLALCKLISSSV